MQAQSRAVLFVLAALAIPMGGCEYSGTAEDPRPPSPQASTEPPRSFDENINEVARLLEASTTDPGLPSEARPNAELSTVLAPGDYVVKAACAGVHSAKLLIVAGDSAGESTDYPCNTAQPRLLRHTGGPITVSATPATGRPAAAGVTLKPNSDPRASELEDMREWASQQLKPSLPNERFGSASSDTSIGFALEAKPGRYELHFLCSGPSQAELSVSTWAGGSVLGPVQVHCNGDVFKAPVQLGSAGADFEMNPGSGPEGRYAFRLVPSA
jgi:hypothetical protein